MLIKLHFPISNFTYREDVSHFVFVTAADSSHFHECMDAVSSVQTYFPNNLVYFYDLSNGSLQRHAKKVNI